MTGQWQGIWDSINGVINLDAIVQVLLVAAPVAAALALAWWGIRKVLKVLMSAFRKGRISL